MKTNQSIGLLAAAFLGLTLSAPAQTQVSDDHKLSPSEVKTLIRSASSPEDHMKLAQYFRQEASDEAAAAKLHDEMAELYEPGSAPSEFKSPSVAEMKGHCREFSRNAKKASAIASKMAEEQEKLAELMRRAPPQGVHTPR